MTDQQPAVKYGQVIHYRLSLHDGAETSEGAVDWEIVTPYVVDILIAHVFPGADRDDLDADLVETKLDDSGGMLRWHGMAGETLLEWTREVPKRWWEKKDDANP